MSTAFCARCKQMIWPGELMFDWNREGFVCPDCFRAYVLEMLQNHTRLLAEELGVPVEEVR